MTEKSREQRQETSAKAQKLLQLVDSNTYAKTEEEKQFLKIVIALFEQNPKHYSTILSSKKHNDKYAKILQWIDKTIGHLLVDDENFKYSLSTKLNWILHGRTSFPKCERAGCDNVVGKHINLRISDELGHFCSTKCSTNDIKVKEKTRNTRIARNPNGKWNSNESILKSKATFQMHCKEDEDFSMKSFRKSQKTRLERYGDKNWNNREKSVKTYKRHCEEDPNFKDSQVQKTKTTKRERYGNENFVNAQKAIQTRKKKYGNAYRTPAEQRRINQSFQENHQGLTSAFQLPGVRERCIETYVKKLGVDCPFKSEAVRNKIVSAWITKYGEDHPWKNAEMRRRIRSSIMQKHGRLNGKAKYFYNEKSFDSSWELAIWIFCKDHGIEIEKPAVSFEYSCNGKDHLYFPDFKIDGQLVEVKGNHFFNEDGKMRCPFRNKSWTDEQYAEICAIYEAKHQCMIDHDVKIMMFEDLVPILSYINDKYGLQHLNQFRIDDERKSEAGN